MVKRLQRHQRERAAGLVNNMRERSCILRGPIGVYDWRGRARTSCAPPSVWRCVAARWRTSDALPRCYNTHPGTSMNNTRELMRVSSLSFEPWRLNALARGSQQEIRLQLVAEPSHLGDSREYERIRIATALLLLEPA